jgi:hypothetical protein
MDTLKESCSERPLGTELPQAVGEPLVRGAIISGHWQTLGD